MFASVEHPKTNMQVKCANRVLLRGLKRRLEKAKGTWSEEVPRIVWAYHTTPQSITKETPFRLGVWFGRDDSCRNPGELTTFPELRGGRIQRRKKGEPGPTG